MDSLKLSTLHPVRGARRPRKVVGRGEGSGHGKTSTRGGKGQTARSGGNVKVRFEGGQTPLYRRIPKLGFRSQQKVLGTNRFAAVNLADLNRFEDGATVDGAALKKAGFGRSAYWKAGYKLLGTGECKKKLTLRVQAVSASAKAKIEAVGGKVEIVALTPAPAPAA